MIKELDPKTKATFEQFNIRPTDDNILRFRGLRFILVDFLDKMELNEEANISLTLVSTYNIARSIDRVEETSGKKFTCSNKAGTGYVKIKRTC